MSRTTLKPGDIIAVDPVKPGVVAGHVVVAENGEDLFFAWTNKPWTEREDMARIGQPGLTRAQAEEVLQGKRSYEGAVIYKVWDEETNTSYDVPESVAEEIERRQAAAAPVTPPDEAENLGKIDPTPLNFDNYPSSGLW